MAAPALQCAVAWATDPGATPVWTDVTAYLQSFRFRRGRQYETDSIAPGQATVVLDNRDRRFDPTWTGGPYGANVKLKRRLRLQAVWQSVTYDLFHGIIAAYRPEIAPHNGDATMVLEAVDLISVLSAAVVSGTFAQQRTDLRIGAILDAIGWPAGERTLATGLIETRAVTLTGTSAWEHLRAVVADEGGTLFVGRDGKVVFQDRYARLRPNVTSQLTLGDGGGSEQLYVDVAFSFDDGRVINRAVVTREGGVAQQVDDSASQTTYFLHGVSLSGGRQVTDADAYALASYLVGRYAQPQLRAGEVQLSAEASPAVMWPHLLGREIGDRIVLRRRPPGGGGAIDQSSTIEGIRAEWDAAGGAYTWAWEVSPNDATQYWVLGDSTYGVLDSTTRLAP
jgi:hypothetical protein